MPDIPLDRPTRPVPNWWEADLPTRMDPARARVVGIHRVLSRPTTSEPAADSDLPLWPSTHRRRRASDDSDPPTPTSLLDRLLKAQPDLAQPDLVRPDLTQPGPTAVEPAAAALPPQVRPDRDLTQLDLDRSDLAPPDLTPPDLELSDLEQPDLEQPDQIPPDPSGPEPAVEPAPLDAAHPTSTHPTSTHPTTAHPTTAVGDVTRTGKPPKVRRPKQSRIRRHRPRHPALGLTVTLVVALVITFVAWVSAEPVWLAAGHQRAVVATITSCEGTGVRRACHAAVTADGGLIAQDVLIAGALPEQQRVDLTLTAAMVTDRGRVAYVGDERGLLVRVGLAAGLLLACGLALGLAGGATRLPTRSGQLGAFGISLLAPLLVQLGMLAFTW